MNELTVLAVDDEPRALADVRHVLEGSARVARVDTAEGGHEALVKLGAGSYDLLFLDVRMPGLDGIEAARRIAENPAPPAVIFTTAFDEYALKAFDAQAIAYLLVTGVFATALGSVAWNIGVNRSGLDVGSLWQNTVPVFSVIITMLMGVMPTVWQVAGGIMVIAGVLYMQRRQRG